MSEERIPPKVENAPGLKWRARKEGWVAFWECRTEIAHRGFKPVMVPLFRGYEPSEIDRQYMSDVCCKMQDTMLVWARGGLPTETEFDGTVASLAMCYQTDRHSGFLKNRFVTRQNYAGLMKRITKDHGAARIVELKGRDMLDWHEAWAHSGIPMAHALMRMFRGMVGFGMTILDDDHCARLSAILSKQRFEMGKPRVDTLTAEMVVAVRAEAHKQGHPAIALAQAIQFECMFRQKDCIGEFVPNSEPGMSDVTDGELKWLYGIRWSEVDESLKLKHVTSKRQKLTTKDLRLMPMVLEELPAGLVVENPVTKALTVNRSLVPASGPVIVDPASGLPYRSHVFRRLWRQIAKAAGVPDETRNQDSRAGAITEALRSGARLQSVRKAATHSTEDMTQKYSREDEQEDAEVARFRSASRKNKSGTET
jgi:hypothetical protein